MEVFGQLHSTSVTLASAQWICETKVITKARSTRRADCHPGLTRVCSMSSDGAWLALGMTHERVVANSESGATMMC